MRPFGPPDASLRLEVRLSGGVQGVGFRQFAQRAAREVGVAGHARNMKDGTVGVVAEGERARLEAFLDRLREGPPAARVEGVEEQWSPPFGMYDEFVIATRYTAPPLVDGLGSKGGTGEPVTRAKASEDGQAGG